MVKTLLGRVKTKKKRENGEKNDKISEGWPRCNVRVHRLLLPVKVHLSLWHRPRYYALVSMVTGC